ncbi:uncharacterized protein LOC121728870 [Aricia agestis]|uniref:uncharacterized protein LOC121728870 n=1 Tax=Aricia agestis TaxID=91739 RepID=UPI001C20728D|nr:uncharacterized protein LOC121728870 [Aricia agestis]
MFALHKLVILLGLGLCVKCVDIKFENVLTSQHGYGWPASLHVAEGNEALMKLSVRLDDQQSCYAKTPMGDVFNVESPPSNEYEKWSEGCGLRVRHVKPEYVGRWRLTANGQNKSLTGWTELHVIDDVETYQPSPITLKDGETQAKVDLTTLDNAYCVVAKPFTESSLVPGHCALTLERTSRSVQGNWDILLGIPGQVAEVRASKHVAVEAERLDTGYVYDANSGKLHLYCNILYTDKDVTFCRFQRTTNSYGYNVMDGLSDGSHSYYGEGFAMKQCGMTVEHPAAGDYGTWRCSVGVGSLVNNQFVQGTPMQALINVPTTPRFNFPQDDGEDNNEPRTVFVEENSEFTLSCQADFALSYCWFQHPNGTQFTPVALSQQSQLFWYSGESLTTGDCAITFVAANASDAGTWVCHMGPRDTIGVEETGQVQLRVTGPLAANQKEIPVTVGEPATIFCHSSNGNRPLEYCRFLSPSYLGINIDSSVTEDNAILGRFYFTPGRDLTHGFCSLEIREVTAEDIGVWTCAAVVDNNAEESRDTATLIVDETASAPRYRAGIIGMSVGVVALIVVLVGYLAYKHNLIPTINRRRNPSNIESTMTMSFSMPSRTSGNPSLSSGSSNEEEFRRH